MKSSHSPISRTRQARMVACSQAAQSGNMSSISVLEFVLVGVPNFGTLLWNSQSGASATARLEAATTVLRGRTKHQLSVGLFGRGAIWLFVCSPRQLRNVL